VGTLIVRAKSVTSNFVIAPISARAMPGDTEARSNVPAQRRTIVESTLGASTEAVRPFPHCSTAAVRPWTSRSQSLGAMPARSKSSAVSFVFATAP
jgi:hypothetical protein